MSTYKNWPLLFALIVCLASWANTQQPYPPMSSHAGPLWFEDVAADAGLTMLNVNGGVDTKRYIIETTGSGVAIIDYDHDGWPDILLVNGAPEGSGRDGGAGKNAPTPHLYRNLHNGKFADVTHDTGLDTLPGWGQGACVGDYDNDGFDDLYITYYGHNRLLRNEHGSRFREVAGLTHVAGDGKSWGTGCAFVDYDRDGKLDLMVANYVDFDVATVPKPGEGMMCVWKGTPVMCGPRGLKYTPNILYHNRGDGTFEDVSDRSGIRKTNGHYCFSVTNFDYNNDGWPDFYVACDSTASILYRNNKDGTFSDVAADAGVAYNEDGMEQAGMGLTIGDMNGDGRPDIFKTNFSDDTASLYRNDGRGNFSWAIPQAGLELNTHLLGWGTMFFDPDNRGVLDLVVANGHVYPEVDTAHLGSTYKEPRLLYYGDGKGHFCDLSSTSGPGISASESGRGLAIADLWNDGRTEVVINNMSSRPTLLVNRHANENHWLELRLEGSKSNRDGIGSRVILTAGGRDYVQELRSGGSYISSNDLRLHFGLGQDTSGLHIRVQWPSGMIESFRPEGIDRIQRIREGGGVAVR